MGTHSEHVRPYDDEIDTSKLPRLPIAPAVHDEERAKAAKLDRHPSMAELSGRTLMWNGDLETAYSAFTGYLRESECLPKRDREIAVLRQAWDCGADYQWGMHIDMALSAGLTREEVDQIPLDPAEGTWAPHEVAIIRAVDDLHATSRVGDRAWAALRDHYDEAQLVELLVFIGSYRMTAYLFNTVGIRPPQGVNPDLPGNSFLFTETV